MNKKEAEEVLKIMTTADSNCSVCAGELMEKFVRKFPVFLKLAEKVYKESFGYDGNEKIPGCEASKIGMGDEYYQKFLKEIKK